MSSSAEDATRTSIDKTTALRHEVGKHVEALSPAGGNQCRTLIVSGPAQAAVDRAAVAVAWQLMNSGLDPGRCCDVKIQHGVNNSDSGMALQRQLSYTGKQLQKSSHEVRLLDLTVSNTLCGVPQCSTLTPLLGPVFVERVQSMMRLSEICFGYFNSTPNLVVLFVDRPLHHSSHPPDPTPYRQPMQLQEIKLVGLQLHACMQDVQC